MTKFKGKLIGDTQYIHKSAQKLLPIELHEKVKKCSKIVNSNYNWNVLKINLKDTNKISLLDYEDFTESAFPALLNSCQVDIAKQTFTIRNHSRNNPPILHRKELLLAPNDKEQGTYQILTQQLENIGAFENITKLGTKANWETELETLGVRVENHEVVDLECLNSGDTSKPVILRFRTAISRNALSVPAKLLYQSGLANEDSSYLDYGCGRGDDVVFFNELNIPAVGWDPHFNDQEKNLKVSDIVNLGFVLNVIEDSSERLQVLKTAFSLTKKCLSVAVMLHSQNDSSVSMPFKDGQLSSIKTFQKYYDQKNIEALLKNELKTNPIAAAPGVFFIFKDEALEQDFLLKRQLGIIRDYEPRDLVSKTNERKEKTEAALRVANNLARHTLIFARKPELEELPKYFHEQLEKSGVSFRRAFDAASQLISEDQLKNAVVAKREQLILFFAMYFFSGRAKYKSLSKSLQKDVRLHFGSMSSAESAAKALLYSLGDEELLYEECYKSVAKELGWVNDCKFTFQSKNLNKLPIRLRGVISIAERLVGSIEGANIIRIHIETKKVTYLSVKEFDTSPLPRVMSRSIVDFRSHNVKNISHTEDGRVKILYQKSAMMGKEDKYYKIQKIFDDQLLSETDLDFSGEGPRFEEFATTLMENKIALPEYKK